MRDQDDRDAQLLIDFLQQLENAGGCLRIKRAGRLVAQQHFRIVSQRPRDRDTLLLSAGQLRGVSVQLLAQPDQFQQILDLFVNLGFSELASF